MLTYDPIPWLMAQEGLPAIRARRRLGLDRDGDEKAVMALERQLGKAQRCDGSFDRSPMKTAGLLNLLDELRACCPKRSCVRSVGEGLRSLPREAHKVERMVACPALSGRRSHAWVQRPAPTFRPVARGFGNTPLRATRRIERAASYLLSVLESQPGYKRAEDVKPGSLRTPCDLCGFFGPYEDRNRPEVIAHGAREMNFYRDYEPLLGPKSPVRAVSRGSFDRPGPSSCFAWGLIPLSYTIEALCRAGYAGDERLRPALNALLGAQRESGGWCRNLGGHPNCTLHAVRALGAHPRLRKSKYAERALAFMHSKNAIHFAAMQAAPRSTCPSPTASCATAWRPQRRASERTAPSARPAASSASPPC